MEIDGNRWKSMEIDGNRWKSMEIDQSYVIKFFVNEGMKSLDILRRLHKHSGPRAFNRSTLYFWIGEPRWGRTDLSEI
jgi:hypothetical protein